MLRQSIIFLYCNYENKMVVVLIIDLLTQSNKVSFVIYSIAFFSNVYIRFPKTILYQTL